MAITDAGDKLTGIRKGNKKDSSGKYPLESKASVLKSLSIAPHDLLSLRDSSVSPHAADMLRLLWRGVPPLKLNESLSSLGSKYGKADVLKSIAAYYAFIVEIHAAINTAVTVLKNNSPIMDDDMRAAACMRACNQAMVNSRTILESFIQSSPVALMDVNTCRKFRRTTSYAFRGRMSQSDSWALSDLHANIMWAKISGKRSPNQTARKKKVQRPELDVFSSEYTGSFVIPEFKDEDWPQVMVDTFGLKGIEFGTWNSQAERLEFIKQSYVSLMELSSILNIKPSEIGCNSRLGLAIGARGRGRATASFSGFRDGTGVINLTRRKGAGALAHEYGHALDFFKAQDSEFIAEDILYASSVSIDNIPRGVALGMDQSDRDLCDRFHSLASGRKVSSKNNEEVDALRLSIKDDISSLWTELSHHKSLTCVKLAMAAFREGIHGKDSQKINEASLIILDSSSNAHLHDQGMLMSAIGSAVESYNIRKSISDSEAQTEFAGISEMKSRSRVLDGAGKPYWSLDEEVWPRCFESFVADELESRGVVNTFLVNGTNAESYASCAANPYAEGDERKRLNNVVRELSVNGSCLNYITSNIIDHDCDLTSGV